MTKGIATFEINIDKTQTKQNEKKKKRKKEKPQRTEKT